MTATTADLASLQPEQLQQLAVDAGFAHPILVGPSSTTHPLVHGFGPVYPADSPSS